MNIVDYGSKKLNKKLFLLFCFPFHFSYTILTAFVNCAQVFTYLIKHRQKHSRRKIILVGLAFSIGDTVAAEPAARHLKKKYPNCLLIWCTRSSSRELVQSNQSVDRIIMVRCQTAWMIVKRLCSGLNIIDLNISGARCPVCKLSNTNTSGVNVDNYYFTGGLLQAFSRSAGLQELNERPKVSISASVMDKIDKLCLPKQFVAIHCRSEDSNRNWTDENWHELALWLQKRGWHVVEVGLAPVLKSKGGQYQSLCGELTLLETAEVIKRASFFVGIDSGPAHLASAVRKDSIILIGKFRQFVFHDPYGGLFYEATLIHSNVATASIPLESVISACCKLGKKKICSQKSVGAKIAVNNSSIAG